MSNFFNENRFARAKWQVCAQLGKSPFYTIYHNKLHRCCVCLINWGIYWIENNNMNDIYIHMVMYVHKMCMLIFAKIIGVGEIDETTGTPSITAQILCSLNWVSIRQYTAKFWQLSFTSNLYVCENQHQPHDLGKSTICQRYKVRKPLSTP